MAGKKEVKYRKPGEEEAGSGFVITIPTYDNLQRQIAKELSLEVMEILICGLNQYDYQMETIVVPVIFDGLPIPFEDRAATIVVLDEINALWNKRKNE
jgi:hypothetical protein